MQHIHEDDTWHDMQIAEDNVEDLKGQWTIYYCIDCRTKVVISVY